MQWQQNRTTQYILGGGPHVEISSVSFFLVVDVVAIVIYLFILFFSVFQLLHTFICLCSWADTHSRIKLKTKKKIKWSSSSYTLHCVVPNSTSCAANIGCIFGIALFTVGLWKPNDIRVLRHTPFLLSKWYISSWSEQRDYYQCMRQFFSFIYFFACNFLFGFVFVIFLHLLRFGLFSTHCDMSQLDNSAKIFIGYI